MELLVAIAIIGLLIAMLIPMLSEARLAAQRTAEVIAARNLVQGYLNVATEDGDRLMPGYKLGLTAKDHRGQPITGEAAARFPWRMVTRGAARPEELYVNQLDRLEAIRAKPAEQHVMEFSLSPTLAMNTTFVGGDETELGFDNEARAAYGKFYATRPTDPKFPDRLITFCSALDGSSDLAPAGAVSVVGWHRILSPYLFGRRWAPAFDPGQPARAWGYVNPRYDGKAVAAMLDGHADLMDEEGQQDMRNWAPLSTKPDQPLGEQPNSPS